MKKENKPFTCQECGQRLPNAGTYHTIKHCGKYHLKRAYEIFGEVELIPALEIEEAEKEGEGKGSP